MVAVITLVGTLGGGVIANWDKIFPSDSGSDGIGVEQTMLTSTTSPQPTAATTPGTTAPSTEASDGCFVTIENPFVTLNEEPDTFSPEIMRVPKGDHAVLESVVVEFAGTQRWLKISVEGRQGWIQDNVIFVSAKSSGCSF